MEEKLQGTWNLPAAALVADIPQIVFLSSVDVPGADHTWARWRGPAGKIRTRLVSPAGLKKPAQLSLPVAPLPDYGALGQTCEHWRTRPA